MSTSSESSSEQHVASKDSTHINVDHLQKLFSDFLENLHQSEVLKNVTEPNIDQLAQLTILQAEEELYRQKLRNFFSRKSQDGYSNTDIRHKSNQVTVDMLTIVPVSIAKSATHKLKCVQAVLKLVEIALGAVAMTYSIHSNPLSHGFLGNLEHTVMLLVAFAFLTTTILLFIPNLLTFIIGDTFCDSIFETLYHIVAFVFYLSVSVALLITAITEARYDTKQGLEGKKLSAIAGLLNSVFYFASALISVILYIRR